ncbi:hypothetical protein ATO46_06600 [Aeromonas schubertii]|nr:hypothetical protein ATO46_06600 [Aeromonas schubertii]
MVKWRLTQVPLISALIIGGDDIGQRGGRGRPIFSMVMKQILAKGVAQGRDKDLHQCACCLAGAIQTLKVQIDVFGQPAEYSAETAVSQALLQDPLPVLDAVSGEQQYSGGIDPLGLQIGGAGSARWGE